MASGATTSLTADNRAGGWRCEAPRSVTPRFLCELWRPSPHSARQINVGEPVLFVRARRGPRVRPVGEWRLVAARSRRGPVKPWRWSDRNIRLVTSARMPDTDARGKKLLNGRSFFPRPRARVAGFERARARARQVRIGLMALQPSSSDCAGSLHTRRSQRVSTRTPSSDSVLV